MGILLTGATGYIGSHVVRHLIDAGHDVTALVRSREKAAAVEAVGATPVIGDLRDADLLAAAVRDSAGVIHLAAPSDDTAAALDTVVVDTVLAELEGSDKPYLHTSGIWVYGDNTAITEASAFDAPPLTAWRLPIDARVRAAQGVRTTLIVPSIVYGDGRGLPNLFAPVEDDAERAVRLVGDGNQHWATVHVDDLAALYVLAVDRASGGSIYIGAGGENPTVRALGEAAARGAGITGRVLSETADASRSRLGTEFADALLLDQAATGALARAELGWHPDAPSLVDELAAGAYAR